MKQVWNKKYIDINHITVIDFFVSFMAEIIFKWNKYVDLHFIGKTLSVYVVAVAKQSAIESEPSRKLHITCPRRPPAVAITQQPSYKAGCVLISWNRPEGHTYATNEEDISLYG